MFSLFFVSHVFLYFSLSKAASYFRYTHCHSNKLELFSNLVSDNSSPHYYGAYQLISLLNLPNSSTTILYDSSLALRFPSVQSWRTWCNKTMAFLSLKLHSSIRSLSNFSLIIAKSFERTGSI